MSLKKSRDFLPVAATKQAVHSRTASSTFIFDKFNYNELNRQIYVCELLKETHFIPSDSQKG